MNNSPKIVVVGAGALGGIVSAILVKNEYDLTLVTKSSEQAELISNTGLNITGYCGSFNAKIPTVVKFSDINTKPDYVFIATKAGDMAGVAKEMLPYIKDSSLIISLQNGIVEEALASIVGKERTVGCSIGWGATMHSNIDMEMTSAGEIVLGYLDKPFDDRILDIRDILSNIIQAEASNEILSYLYSKLIINSCISTLGAVSGLLLGEMLRKKAYRLLFLKIIKEAIEVADAMELKVPPYAGKLNYYKLLSWNSVIQHLYLEVFGFKYKKLKSSSLQSLERGKKTEVNNFNGYIAMKGIQYNISTPINSKLTAIIMEIESGNRKISDNNKEDLI